jgi:multicomponent Na+:H+ antiporter subunit B
MAKVLIADDQVNLRQLVRMTLETGRFEILEAPDGETALELADAAGEAGFVVVALGGLVFGLAAMHNFLGYGITGSLWSAGTIPVLNASVGIEVAGGVTLIVAEFLDQALLRRRGG